MDVLAVALKILSAVGLLNQSSTSTDLRISGEVPNDCNRRVF